MRVCIVLFVGLLISLAIVQIDGKVRRFSYGKRYYRPYTIFARPRAVWHTAPKGLRYRQLDEHEKIPDVQPGIRKRIWFVKPNAIRRRILRSTPCIVPRASSKVMFLIREALRKVNVGGKAKFALENIDTANIRSCKKCDAKGQCTYDHTKVSATVTLAPSCSSGKCKCGFEAEGIRQKCRLSARTKYGMRADDLTIQCNEEVSTRPKQQNKDTSKEVPVTTSSNQIVTTSQSTTTTAALASTTAEEMVTKEVTDPALDYDLTLEPGARPAPILSAKNKVPPEEILLQ